MRTDHPNLDLVRAVARALGALRERFVFLGGAATNLLISDPAAPAVRPTRDVDVVVEVSTTYEYLRVEGELRALGSTPDETPGAPRCRWVVAGVLLDVMSTDPTALGFASRWYPLAYQTARPIALETDLTIRVVAPPLFLATKLEAYRGRGKGDVFASRDIEDLIAVIDGRVELMEEIAAVEPEVRAFLRAEFEALLQMSDFQSAVAGHLPPDGASQARVDVVLSRIEAIARL